jgi:hypothetical protein
MSPPVPNVHNAPIQPTPIPNPVSGTTGQIHAAAQPNRNSFVHFAEFPAQAESEQSWNPVSTPGLETKANHNMNMNNMKV